MVASLEKVLLVHHVLDLLQSYHLALPPDKVSVTGEGGRGKGEERDRGEERRGEVFGRTEREQEKREIGRGRQKSEVDVEGR